MNGFPATAPARSNATASSGSRANRRPITAATASGTAAGATSTRPDWAKSWPNSHTNNGFPALRSTIAPRATAETVDPTAMVRSSAAASADRGGTASVTPTRASSATCSTDNSSDRYVPTNRQPTSRSRAATAVRTRSVAASAHWRSSRTTTIGPFIVSARMTSATASVCANWAAGEAAGDSATNWARVSSDPASWRRTCTHGHNGGAPSPCHAVAQAGAHPSLAAEPNDLLGEPGLADTGLARQQHQSAARPVQIRDVRGHDSELRVASDDLARRALRAWPLRRPGNIAPRHGRFDPSRPAFSVGRRVGRSRCRTASRSRMYRVDVVAGSGSGGILGQVCTMVVVQSANWSTIA